ncbi:hypothetical protein [Sulfurimonas sp.]|uniref:hypothetical protein n=1 Tax=Sulfurimonas sp. TaxID=2022749 RepID=UPI003565AFBF
MKILKTLLSLTLLSSILLAGPAITGTRIFTQPDGTKFEGVLKGDSSFHWIESDGNAVVYDPKDKFYYKATIDKDKGLIPTKEKPNIKVDNKSSAINENTKKHDISKEDKKSLKELYKKSKTGNYPR